MQQPKHSLPGTHLRKVSMGPWRELLVVLRLKTPCSWLAHPQCQVHLCRRRCELRVPRGFSTCRQDPHSLASEESPLLFSQETYHSNRPLEQESSICQRRPSFRAIKLILHPSPSGLTSSILPGKASSRLGPCTEKKQQVFWSQSPTTPYPNTHIHRLLHSS